MSRRPRFPVGPNTDRQNAYVYLIARRVGARVLAPVQIGVADDLAPHVATLQACCPFETSLVHALHFPAGRIVATLLQGKFEDRHIDAAIGRGWYDMEPAVALNSLLERLNALPAWKDDAEDTRRTIMNYLNAGDEAEETLRILTSEMGVAQ